MKAARLPVIGGITVKVPTGCGNMYIQMNWQNGKIFEVFATLGKTGGCATSQSEAVTRSVTVGLRCGVPVSEYIKQLGAIRCPNPRPFPKETAVDSCADALSKTLALYGNLGFEDVIKFIRQANMSSETPEEEQARAMIELEHLKEERDRVEG